MLNFGCNRQDLKRKRKVSSLSRLRLTEPTLVLPDWMTSFSLAWWVYLSEVFKGKGFLSLKKEHLLYMLRFSSAHFTPLCSAPFAIISLAILASHFHRCSYDLSPMRFFKVNWSLYSWFHHPSIIHSTNTCCHQPLCRRNVLGAEYTDQSPYLQEHFHSTQWSILSWLHLGSRHMWLTYYKIRNPCTLNFYTLLYVHLERTNKDKTCGQSYDNSKKSQSLWPFFCSRISFTIM